MQEEQEIVAIFEAEVEGLLGALAAAIDEEPTGWDLESLVIIAHTLKGTSRMVEARSMAALAHILEECLLELDGTADFDAGFVALIREGCDLLESIAEDFGADRSEDIAAHRQRVARFIDPDRLALEVPADPEELSWPSSMGQVPPGPREGAGVTIRIGAEKVDLLMGLASDFLAVGHSLCAQQRASSQACLAWSEAVRRRPDLVGIPEVDQLIQILTELEGSLANTTRQHTQATQEFHDRVRQLRMLRTSTLSGIFSKTVRSAARLAGKQARFVVEGGATEIDRVVLDTLRDPLIHMIRNAIAHGIEDPQTRERAGKPAAGTITLASRSSGTSVVLEIRDDGAGLDLEAIRRRAVERGLMSADEARAAPHEALSELIFSSGLSTAEDVGELSGRGVGMSVVRDNIRELGGTVVVSSEPGRGCTIGLEIPLTRLTTYGIHVRLGAHHFFIPITSVRATSLVAGADIEHVDGREVIHVNGQPLPLLRLERAFDFAADESERRPVVVVRDGHKTQAIMIDEVLGQTEVIIQSLSWKIDHVRGVSGAAVLDGDLVVPVLDVHGLLAVDAGLLPAGSVRTDTAAAAARRLLVVDDSITSRTLLKNILSAAGYEVEVSVDAEQALARLQAESFDLIVTDVEMPGADGFELTQKIRASRATRDLPVIICTSLGDGAEKARGAAAGANAYVVKGTFEQDELLATIGRLV